MNHRSAIEHALRSAEIPHHIKSIRDLSGGCIHQVSEILLDDGQRFVAKLNRAANLQLFEEEAHGLHALTAANTVLVPKPIITIAHEDTAVLLMTAIEAADRRATSDSWLRFGEALAALHHAGAGNRYGFDVDNHIGSTPQPNNWHDDWVEFNAVNRLGHQLRIAADRQLIRNDEINAVQRVIDRLDQFIPRHPKPALLHGDLWSGNALPTSNGRIALIDPACSIGDGWADIAMMRLFGGFPQPCFEAYAQNVTDHDHLEQRIAIYQLYHVLNHVNIFGRSYMAQAMNIAHDLS